VTSDPSRLQDDLVSRIGHHHTCATVNTFTVLDGHSLGAGYNYDSISIRRHSTAIRPRTTVRRLTTKIDTFIFFPVAIIVNAMLILFKKHKFLNMLQKRFDENSRVEV